MCYFVPHESCVFFIISLTITLVGLQGMNRSVLTTTCVNKQLLMCMTDVSYDIARVWTGAMWMKQVPLCIWFPAA